MTDTPDKPDQPKVITGTVAIRLDPVAVANMLRRRWSGDPATVPAAPSSPEKEE